MGLLTYSGISTKVRAMEGKLISDRQFKEMASLEDVRSAVEYLRQQPAYADIFANLDGSRLHRGNIEQLLTQTEYRDFAKLYRFANLSQRRFLDLYFMHYEIDIIKQVLRHVIGHREAAPDITMFREFFERHSALDLVTLSQAEDLTDFIARLSGSPYYVLLNRLAEKGQATVFDYEMQLDLLYLKTLWKTRTKTLGKQDQAALEQAFGCRLDLLNIQWIYRARKYYSLAPADIYALLIPVNYKLQKEQIKHLAEAPSMEEFFAVVAGTRYGRMSDVDLSVQPDVAGLYHEILNRIYRHNGRRHPYTAAVLDSYLFFKELEMQKIITTLEGIRYGLEAGEICALAEKQ